MVAFTKQEIFNFLESEGYLVYKLETNQFIELLYGQKSFSKRKMKTKDLVFWLTQLSTYLKSGIPLTDSMRILNLQLGKSDPYKKRLFDAIVYQLIMGIMLGYVACVGGSVLYSIILHFLNNAFVLLFGCFSLVGYLSEETYYYNIYSMIFPVCLFMLGAILVGILFWVLKYLRTKNFFRYVPKKKKKKMAEEPVETKLGLKDMWKNMEYKEKIFAIVGIILIGSIWLVNTISQFIVT
jgi:hypothetical protein